MHTQALKRGGLVAVIGGLVATGCATPDLSSLEARVREVEGRLDVVALSLENTQEGIGQIKRTDVEATRILLDSLEMQEKSLSTAIESIRALYPELRLPGDEAPGAAPPPIDVPPAE